MSIIRSRHILLGAFAFTAATGYLNKGWNSNSCIVSKRAYCEKADKFEGTAFYPPLKHFKKELLRVSDVHSISYSLYGNPAGKPVLFVHGGPGGGTQSDMARYFDPKFYLIVLVDQRGCGDSIPFANLEENTTQDSIRDFEKLRKLLGIQKWQVFGGSWGSTLALAYAMEHPAHVSELVLRGIFLVRQKEIAWLYQGPGANYLFPEDWAKYESAIPPEERGDYLAAYGRRLRGELGDAEMFKAAKAWSVWEGRTSKLIQDSWTDIEDKFNDHFSLAFARIENHYFTHKGFLPREGYLLEKENIDKIRHIPTVIVQGRYDVVCPPISAYELKQQFPEAELQYTLQGHSGYERDTIACLVAATDKFKHL